MRTAVLLALLLAACTADQQPPPRSTAAPEAVEPVEAAPDAPADDGLGRLATEDQLFGDAAAMPGWSIRIDGDLVRLYAGDHVVHAERAESHRFAVFPDGADAVFGVESGDTYSLYRYAADGTAGERWTGLLYGEPLPDWVPASVEAHVEAHIATYTRD